MKRYSFLAALSVVLLFALSASATADYGFSLIDQNNTTDASNALNAPDSAFAVIDVDGGYVTVEMPVTIAESSLGRVTVWYTGECDAVALDFGESPVISSYTLPTGQSPYVKYFTPSAETAYFKILGGCSVDAIEYDNAPPTPTPTVAPTSTPTPALITPGVSGADMVGYLGIFNGWEPVIALFFACGLVGAFFGIITSRRGIR